MKRPPADALHLQPIGVIQSAHRRPAGTPIQPNYAAASRGTVVVDPQWAPALADLEGFEHIWLVYWFDRAGPYKPRVVPYRDRHPHGLFATRAPNRPNPIGLSVVRLLARAENVLQVDGLDILDQTPLLDLKPYVPDFDSRPTARAGWLDGRRANREVADDRFHHTQERSEKSPPDPGDEPDFS